MRLFLLLPLLGLASCAAQETRANPPAVRLEDPKLTEASGLAISQRDPGFLWLVNDSGSAPIIHLADTHGHARGTITLKGVKNTDWEDLASFKLDGNPYLLVADFGDNDARRDEVALHIVAEPKLPAADDTLGLTLKPDWTIRFRYEGGPRDCESVAIDLANDHIILITKRDRPPMVYQLPLRKPAKRGVLTAEKLGPLARLPLPPTSLPHPYGTQPTGLDFSPDGRLVIGYRGAYLFRRAAEQSWTEAFALPPEILADHKLAQAEAIAFSRDGKTILMTSEGKRPRLLTVPVPPATP